MINLMKHFLTRLLFVLFFGVSLFAVSSTPVKADLCPQGDDFANCFPVSDAASYGIDLSSQASRFNYSYCTVLEYSGQIPYVCAHDSFMIGNNIPECPSGGAPCRPYSAFPAPGPIVRGYSQCTAQGNIFGCCYGQDKAEFGDLCLSTYDILNNPVDCCESGQTLCTTDSGTDGFCTSEATGSLRCGSRKVCAEIVGDINDPGTFACTCRIGEAGRWNCSVGGLTNNSCNPWGQIDQTKCGTGIARPDWCDRDTCTNNNIPCISTISTDVGPLKEHGESCQLFYDLAEDENSPAPHNCNPADGLWCHPIYEICLYPDNSRSTFLPSDQNHCVDDRECLSEFGAGGNQEYNDFECVDSSDVPCYINNLRSGCTCKLPENRDYRCEWTSYDDAESSYYGRPAYCMYGFRSVEELRASLLVFDCESGCGGLLAQFYMRLTGWDGQHISMRNFEAGLSDDGSYYTCVTGDFDGSIKASIESCLERQGIAVIPGAVAGGAVGAVVGSAVPIPGTSAVGITVGAVGGAQIASSIFNCAPTISGEVRLGDGINACSANLEIRVDLTTDVGSLDGSHAPYFLCASNLEEGSQAYNDCIACYGDGSGASGKRIWTSIGCIEQDPRSIVSKFITIGTGLLGGIFLLRVLAAAFMLTTSQGDVKKTSEAKEMITEAVVGVLFVIFSVTILQFIGADVMKIPGFGGPG